MVSTVGLSRKSYSRSQQIISRADLNRTSTVDLSRSLHQLRSTDNRTNRFQQITSPTCFLIDWFIHWLIDWLVGWLIDWSIDWLIEWLIDSLFDWSIHCLFNWSIDCVTDWLANWLIERFPFPPNHSPLPLKLLITQRVVLSVYWFPETDDEWNKIGFRKIGLHTMCVRGDVFAGLHKM